MRQATPIGIAALGLLAAAAQSAGQTQSGPALRTALPCYLPDQSVAVSGSGFTPGHAYTVSLDRAGIGGGTVRPDGTLSGTLSSGALPRGVTTVRHELGADDGQLRGSASFEVSAFSAGFIPKSGDPRTLKVRYSVHGLGVAAPAGTYIWLHYLSPGGHLRKTVAIGRTSYPCGSLRISRRHRLFPFHVAPRGRWRLQFDLEPAFSPVTEPRIVRAVVVR
jgi:hypothetical protein